MTERHSRRAFVAAAGATAGSAVLARHVLPHPTWLKDRRKSKSRVAILSATDYARDLDDTLFRGLRLFRLDIQGRTILLKPNLVEYLAGVEVNTNALLVGAAIDAFLRLGAERVVVAEGPGHQRDTYLLLAESGLDEQLRLRKVEFVDLNRDAVVSVPIRSGYSGLGRLWLPQALLSAEVVVSMPKIKTHHWAGVTLSMKNMFGVIPGLAYGWPKNILHWKGIHECILDICATVPPHFVIADGVVAMEGNGPLHGSHRHWTSCSRRRSGRRRLHLLPSHGAPAGQGAAPRDCRALARQRRRVENRATGRGVAREGAAVCRAARVLRTRRS